MVSLTCKLRPLTRSLGSLRTLSTPAPWFVEPEPEPEPAASRSLRKQARLQEYKLPANAPTAIKTLFNKLADSPYLEPNTLKLRTTSAVPGPSLQWSRPKGKRSRMSTYSGEGLASNLEDVGCLWEWQVMAEVKELYFMHRLFSWAYTLGQRGNGEPGCD